MSRSAKVKPKKPWQDIAREAQDYRDATIAQVKPPIPDLSKYNRPTNVISIPKEILDPTELLITQLPPEELVALLASGRLSATVVTKAFLRRAGVAQKLVMKFAHLFGLFPR